MASRLGSDDDADNNKGSMWALEQKLDQPMDEEAARLKNMYREKKFSALLLLRLAYQSLGVVYGDLGTSPLYVFYNTFPHGAKDREDVIGALSLIIYSLTLVPLLKYVFIVLRANDNGQGGTFALYSLLCRHANLKIIPNQHRTDEELTTYSRATIHERSFAAKTKRWLETHAFNKNSILMLVLVGTCMVIGDGILTPAISVLSAAGGIKVNRPDVDSGVVVLVAVVILVGLFSLQHYGTDRVGWLFAPIVLLWFLLIGGIGMYNIWNYDSSVLKAFSPVYIYRYLRRGGREGWTSLGGILLSITGTEALFADLAHFPVSSVQIAFTLVVFPCLLLAYSGQAAYLLLNLDHTKDAFYRSIPVWHCHWILVVIFTLTSLVVECTYFSAVLFKVDQGGWAPLVIAGVFFIIMYVWHYGTLKRYEFEMHSKVSMAWVLGLGPSLGLVRVPGVGLVYTELASGVPHIFSHFITNLPAIHSVVVFVCVKYLPVYTVPEEERFLVKRIGPKNFHMFRCVARYGYKDLHKKDDDFEKKLFHNLFVFVKLESMMEGFSDSDEYSLYGQQTVESRDAVLNNNNNDNTASSNVDLSISTVDSIVPVRSPSPVNITVQSSDRVSSHTEVDELEFLNNCRDAGVVHILGNTVVRARRDSRFYKKIAVDYIYAFLRKICREHNSFMLTTNEAYGSNLKKKGSMWALDQNLDEPIDDDAVRIRNISKEKKFSALLILRLAYQSLGVVYGDLGTSPLYVFYNTFPHGAKDQEDIRLSIAVLSAVGGIKLTIPDVKNEVVVLVSVAIIVGLFSLQHYGTDRVGWLFAPIVLLWLLLIGAIGIYNILNYDRSVLRAFSPVYIYRYLKRGRREDWTSLGGIMLSITGTEALFADLAHFPVSSVQIAFTVLVFPCLLLAYSGQAAYLLNNLDHTQDAFYRSIPDKMYWPVFVVATGAAVVASQATISATSSIIKQARAHGCFPRVKIVHTSKKFLGQIYIPDINWILMVLCITVTAGFENQSQIGNAYVWHCHWILAIIFAGVSLLVELSYCSAVLFKVDQGSWIPFLIAGAFFIVMYVWHYGKLKRYEFEMHSKVSMAWVLGLGPSLGLVRVPGVGLVYTQLSRGVPHIFSHFITNLPAIHSVVIFVCVKYLPVYTVPEEERFLVKRIGPKSLHMFRCVARYGYKDLHRRDDDFENKLFESLFLFVKLDCMMEGCSDSENYSSYEQTPAESNNNNENTHSSNMDLSVMSVDSLESDRSESHGNIASRPPEVDELEFLNKCRDAGGGRIIRTRKNILERPNKLARSSLTRAHWWLEYEPVRVREETRMRI
ncbi:hypothetical protein AHAS_Ahas14G0094700 [Arachis hypogaea]